MSDTGPSAACLALARSNRVLLFWSEYTLREIRGLPVKLPSKFKVTADRVEAFVPTIGKFAELIDPVPPVYINPLDVNDSPYIDLALAASADLITPWDQHLRGLMDPSTSAGQDFLNRFPQLHILSPVELLARVGTVRHG